MQDRNAPEAATPQPARRRRNAAATRQAILDSARLAFTRFGYDGVGVREIAQNAGVTAMLVNRYFGSKEKLFEEVIEVTLATPGVIKRGMATSQRDPAMFCREVASALVANTAPGVTPLDGILILIRSAANKQAGKMLRENALELLQPLIDMLPGPDPDVRAALLLSAIAGFQLMRQVIEMPALAEADAAVLSQQLTALFEPLLVKKGNP
jgi:AcrR family transcriptional regulator